MGLAVHIQSRVKRIKALRVLDTVGGTWQGIGTSDDPIYLLTDAQYNALVEAGVISATDKEVKARGKKITTKQNQP